jgi:monoamine oxidase
MLDVVIVGAGACGLALARELAREGVSFAAFEARDRLGGRVLSIASETTGDRLDLGPTWFWPDTQPTIVRLVSELGLASFDQHDPGTALLLAEADKKPETRSTPRLHAGAKRLVGGMASLIEALARDLPPGSIELGWTLRAIADRGDHVELRFEAAGESRSVLARRAALAIPPRLLEQNVRFDPPLDATTREAMRATPTWMAAQAKALVGFEGPPSWRADGHSGNAFVTHEQAVLGEVFDACDASGGRAALGGFFALSAELREAFEVGLQMLVDSQFVQLFGKGVEGGEQHVQDWAKEPFTCADADRTPPADHPEYGDPLLRTSLWERKLYLGSTETAREGGGYLEGALTAARRIRLQLLGQREAPIMAPGSSDSSSPDLLNQTSLARFDEWVRAKRALAFASYRQRLNFSLSQGQREQMTQRAMLGTMEAVFKEALIVLEGLPFDHAHVGVERGRSDLTPLVQKAFDGFIQELLDAVIEFNRTSCALSNFPDEHKLDKEYIGVTLRDIAAAWREFSLDANQILLDKRVVSPAS